MNRFLLISLCLFFLFSMFSCTNFSRNSSSKKHSFIYKSEEAFILQEKGSHIVYLYWEKLWLRLKDTPDKFFEHFENLWQDVHLQNSSIVSHALEESFQDFCRTMEILSGWEKFCARRFSSQER